MKKLYVSFLIFFFIFSFVYFFSPKIAKKASAGTGCNGKSCPAGQTCQETSPTTGECFPSTWQNTPVPGGGGGGGGGGGDCTPGAWTYCEYNGQSACKRCMDSSSWGVCATKDYPGNCSKPAPTQPPITPITCGLFSDKQASFETGIDIGVWKDGGNANATLSSVSDDHHNGLKTMKVVYTGATNTNVMTIFTGIHSAPISGQEASFTGWVKINSKSGNAALKACVDHTHNWGQPVWNLIGTDCVDIDTGNIGQWQQFTVSSPFKDASENVTIPYFLPSGSDGSAMNIFIDNLCYSYQTIPRPSLCKSATISSNTLSSGGSLTITSTAKTIDMKRASYYFYNLDNLYGPGNPKPIYFVADTHYGIVKEIAAPTRDATYSTPVNFADLDKVDLNNNSQKPAHIQVNAYFTDTQNHFSAPEAACVVQFQMATAPTATPVPPTAVPPTATPVPGCACETGDTCASNCPVNTEANRFTTAPIPIPTYSVPMKCAQQDVNLYPTPPASTDKNSFCNRQYRPKGDVDGDGHVTTQDYFYYVSAGNGGTLPADVNTDVNGDGVTDARDRAIIVRGRAAGI